MPALDEIPGIGAASLQLLAAAGIDTVEQLAAQNLDHLVAELKNARKTLSAAKRAPGKAKVLKWIKQANELRGEFNDPDFSREVEPPVNLETDPEVTEMLTHAPCAIPLPGNILMGKGIRVSDVPAGLLLSSYPGDPVIPVGDAPEPKLDLPTPRLRSNVELIAIPHARQSFTSTVSQAETPLKQRDNRMPASKSGHEEDRVALIRAPRAETNLGKNPESRAYIRGVLHTHPWTLRLGAIFSLLLLINFILAVASAFLLLASRESPDFFSWVPAWILAFPIALPVTGIGYMLWGFAGKCRICNQKLFISAAALKHVRSHRIWGLGFVVPLSLHLLAFNWFRCSSCGTPVRLKK